MDELLGSPLCPSGEMPPAFEARLTRRIAKANHLLGQAARASSTRGRNKRLAAAGRVFGDVVRRVGKAARKAGSQTVAPACQTRLDAELGDLQQRISGLRTAPLT